MGMSMLIKRRHNTTSEIMQLVGLDLTLQEVAENFIYGNDDALLAKSYSFLMNRQGQALIHPLLDRQVCQSNPQMSISKVK
jgi:hypothetical protein